jgi:lysozyme
MIDVYSGDGVFYWKAVKHAGHSVEIAKCSTGSTGVDPMFLDYMRGMKDAGMIRGAYHWLTCSAPVQQAANFIKCLEDTQYDYKSDLPPAVDIEDPCLSQLGRDLLIHNISVFLRTVERVAGRPLLFYVNRSMADEYFGNGCFGGHPLWLAEYNLSPTPVLPVGWKTWRFWQYSESGTVPGVPNAGQTDLNRHNGTLDELKAWIACGK